MLILRKKVSDIYPNQLIFSAKEDENGKLRYTTALVTRKYTNVEHNSVCLHMLDTFLPDAEEQLMVLPADEELILAVNSNIVRLGWFVIGTIISSLIWLGAIYLIR